MTSFLRWGIPPFRTFVRVTTDPSNQSAVTSLLSAFIFTLVAWVPSALAESCPELKAQPFLIRANMKKDPRGFKAAVAEAVKWRVNTYGFVPRVSPKHDASVSAPSQAVESSFFGLTVRLHARILPALSCVEAALIAECQISDADTYLPRTLSGLRERNTYRGGEISNHMFGIALDLDPDRNPCCGCVPPWSDAPQCKIPSKDPLDRAALTGCWVRVFERHGFYWLGHDPMQDTMHFEFLADPAIGT
jgi:hypothetical protein